MSLTEKTEFLFFFFEFLFFRVLPTTTIVFLTATANFFWTFYHVPQTSRTIISHICWLGAGEKHFCFTHCDHSTLCRNRDPKPCALAKSRPVACVSVFLENNENTEASGVRQPLPRMKYNPTATHTHILSSSGGLVSLLHRDSDKSVLSQGRLTGGWGAKGDPSQTSLIVSVFSKFASKVDILACTLEGPDLFEFESPEIRIPDYQVCWPQPWTSDWLSPQSLPGFPWLVDITGEQVELVALRFAQALVELKLSQVTEKIPAKQRRTVKIIFCDFSHAEKRFLLQEATKTLAVAHPRQKGHSLPIENSQHKIRIDVLQMVKNSQDDLKSASHWIVEGWETPEVSDTERKLIWSSLKQNQGRIQDFGQGGQWSFDPRGEAQQNFKPRGALRPKFAQIRDFSLKIAWNLGGKGRWGRAPRAPLDPPVKTDCRT